MPKPNTPSKNLVPIFLCYYVFKKIGTKFLEGVLGLCIGLAVSITTILWHHNDNGAVFLKVIHTIFSVLSIMYLLSIFFRLINYYGCGTIDREEEHPLV